MDLKIRTRDIQQMDDKDRVQVAYLAMRDAALEARQKAEFLRNKEDGSMPFTGQLLQAKALAYDEAADALLRARYPNEA